MSKNISKTIPAGGNIVHAPFRPTLFSRVATAVKGWHSRRLAIRELNAMPDALLRDIGIERYQIKDAVNNFGARPEIFRMRNEKVFAAHGNKKAA